MQVADRPELSRPWALKALPPFPAIALRILEVLAKEDFDSREVTRLISSDPVFAADLLRVANSALFGFSREVRSVQQATVALGSDMVRSMALAVALRGFLRNALRVPVLRRCWKHCLATAILSDQIAKAQMAATGRSSTEDAYTAGLLHDIGRLALLVSFPAEYANALEVSREDGIDLLACERALFDVDHCEAGLYLAAEWNLPPDITAAIGGHHGPAQDAGMGDLGWIVPTACQLADGLGFGAVPGKALRPVGELLRELPDNLRGAFDEDTLRAGTKERIALLE